MILHGGADELLRRRVYAEVKDLDAAALHHDLDEVFADVVHVALHGAEAHAADGLGALTDHQGLQKLCGGGHAARGHEHFGNERAVGGERLAEAVHADDHALGENVARPAALVERLLAEGEQLFLLAALECAGDVPEHIGRLLRGGCGLHHLGLCGTDLTLRHGGERRDGDVQPRVVLVHGLIEVLIHVREDRTGKAVGDRGDEVPAGAAARERVSCVGENFIRLRIRAVDGRAEAAHERELAA